MNRWTRFSSARLKKLALPLRWPERIPDARQALAAAEWVRRHEAHAFARFQKSLFEAHFVAREDLGAPAVIDRHATEAGIRLDALRVALADGSAGEALRECEAAGRRLGVKGTPAWLVGHELVTGLHSAAEFERMAGRAVLL